ncbi:MAG: DUF3489 domain-containing protein [Sterolibacteriaceae bacterium]|uniref:DUF3489 domain-containing protein n=1 Tax=Candidatus Methylophosphatis roskildensis TaxID=2899263 RepID=A0A9D7HVE1_9PROT|nr:DUF3489 domain-containing protein [Candidatus Methylophosphatis roskildensis]
MPLSGRKRPAPPIDAEPANAVDDLQLLEGIPVRSGTKLAALVVALCRPQGATTLQLMLATGWQQHTVRGAISAQVRKKLGINVVAAKVAGGETVYRIGRPSRHEGSEPNSHPWGMHACATRRSLAMRASRPAPYRMRAAWPAACSRPAAARCCSRYSSIIRAPVWPPA